MKETIGSVRNSPEERGPKSGSGRQGRRTMLGEIVKEMTAET